jgi:hypothetical protein
MRSTIALSLFFAIACGRADAATSAPADDGSLRGKLLERIDAGSYSYLRLAASSGEVWAAVPVTDVAVGASVTVEQPIWMQDFEGKAIGRKFARIAFGTLSGAAPSRPPATPPLPSTFVHPPREAGADPGKIAVEPLAGPSGQTVEQVFARRASLSGKQIGVRGKVVKVTSGVMGRNWVHLRDGTGSSGSDDLLVTTTDDCKVGDVVTARGTARTDQDFGAGYKYPVLIEGASLQFK